jgi:hypothetical protein
VGEWNDEEIVLNSRQAKVTLNNTVILDVDLDAALKGGTLSGKEHPGARRTTGKIGFLGHGDHVEYRDIRIKTLPAPIAHIPNNEPTPPVAPIAPAAPVTPIHPMTPKNPS